MYVGLTQSVEDQTYWIEPKGSEGILSSWWCVLARLVFCSWTGTYTINPPASQAFAIRLKLYRGFPRSPACWLLISGLFSLHNHGSQILIYLCMCVCVCVYVCDGLCFSGEPWLIQRLYQSSVSQFSAVLGSQCCFSQNYMSLWEIERRFPRKIYIHFPYLEPSSLGPRVKNKFPWEHQGILSNAQSLSFWVPWDELNLWYQCLDYNVSPSLLCIISCT